MDTARALGGPLMSPRTGLFPKCWPRAHWPVGRAAQKDPTWGSGEPVVSLSGHSDGGSLPSGMCPAWDQRGLEALPSATSKRRGRVDTCPPYEAAVGPSPGSQPDGEFQPLPSHSEEQFGAHGQKWGCPSLATPVAADPRCPVPWSRRWL